MVILLLAFWIGVAGSDAAMQQAGLVDVGAVSKNVRVELKYAGADNFMGRPLYGDLTRCYLQPQAAAQLRQAAQLLSQRAPDTVLLLYDCARPHSVQLAMWELVKDTPQKDYVANPHTSTASVHNYGCAVDLTLAKSDGSALDMGTPYDFFGPAAHPRHEGALLGSGSLNHSQVANRLLLREVMVRAGFYTINNEWWHFNCMPSHQTRKHFKRIE